MNSHLQNRPHYSAHSLDQAERLAHFAVEPHAELNTGNADKKTEPKWINCEILQI